MIVFSSRNFMRVVICTALITSVGKAAAQRAEDTSANFIYSGCKSFAEQQLRTVQLTMLGNFCGGVLHGLALVGKNITVPQWQSCVPPTSDSVQLARVVVKFLDEHPQRMREDFRVLAVEAFHQAWPCDGTKRAN
jgi:hypothetical protein